MTGRDLRHRRPDRGPLADLFHASRYGPSEAGVDMSRLMSCVEGNDALMLNLAGE